MGEPTRGQHAGIPDPRPHYRRMGVRALGRQTAAGGLRGGLHPCLAAQGISPLRRTARSRTKAVRWHPDRPRPRTRRRRNSSPPAVCGRWFDRCRGCSRCLGIVLPAGPLLGKKAIPGFAGRAGVPRPEKYDHRATARISPRCAKCPLQRKGPGVARPGHSRSRNRPAAGHRRAHRCPSRPPHG